MILHSIFSICILSQLYIVGNNVLSNLLIFIHILYLALSYNRVILSTNKGVKHSSRFFSYGPEKCFKVSLFYMFSKLVHIHFNFSDNVHIHALYIY